MCLATYQPPWWIPAAFGAGSGALAALLVNAFLGWWRRKRMLDCLDLKPQVKKGRRVTARVCNGYNYSPDCAYAYITITHELSDVVQPPPGIGAYIVPNEPQKVCEDRLCWSVSGNPSKVDIYPGEQQALDIVSIDSDLRSLEFPSDDGWGSDAKAGKKSRVFLKWKKYDAKIKIVSKNSKEREFEVLIDPDNEKTPLSRCGS